MDLDGKSILDVNIDYDLIKWKKRESEISATINRMGPNNMAAIDQCKEYEERKSYLSMQEDDLITALNSLEDAIRKIDKDTKERFKSTFDKVNKKLQEIFPKLFNGGKAYLEMTENDLLKTGVVVFASPPGKKLTSINLLSGGEKALTALSLVFALFSLNPSSYWSIPSQSAWPFNSNEWYLMINLAITQAGPNSNTVFPNQMEIDYVRVYQENTTSIESVSENENIIYPNPSNNSMTISFSVLSQSSPIEITIRNIIGQEIYQTSYKPQSNNIDWTWHGIKKNGAIAPSGTYFISLTQLDQISTRKITLLK